MSMIGKVIRDFHHSATYVRINIPRENGIPLSVKAHPNSFPRDWFVKGAAVEVEQSVVDWTKFRVMRVFKETKGQPAGGDLTFHVHVESAEDFVTKQKGGEEKVQFYLGPQYFKHSKMAGVLTQAFKMTVEEISGSARFKGLPILCTTDQFARFLIYRDLNGITNGFKDLCVKLVNAEPKPDVYQQLAEMVGISRTQAKSVAIALAYSASDLEGCLMRYHPKTSRALDVSDR